MHNSLSMPLTFVAPGSFKPFFESSLLGCVHTKCVVMQIAAEEHESFKIESGVRGPCLDSRPCCWRPQQRRAQAFFERPNHTAGTTGFALPFESISRCYRGWSARFRGLALQLPTPTRNVFDPAHPKKIDPAHPNKIAQQTILHMIHFDIEKLGALLQMRVPIDTSAATTTALPHTLQSWGNNQLMSTVGVKRDETCRILVFVASALKVRCLLFVSI